MNSSSQVFPSSLALARIAPLYERVRRVIPPAERNSGRRYGSSSLSQYR
jgi:hypothetical protein